MKKVGLSLSFCIRDILNGKVHLQDVAFISANTKVSTPAQWDEVIKHYRKIYWYEKGDEAEMIVRRLIGDELIVQPRLKHQMMHLNPNQGYWVDLEDYNEYVLINLHFE